MNFISKLIFEILPPNEKISVIDCGAKGGGEALKWSFLGDRIIVYGFDPDEAECERLNFLAQVRGFQHFYYPICLAQTNQQSRKFYLTKQIYSHSLYQPDINRISRWKQWQKEKLINAKDNLGIDKVVEIPTTTLDTWADANNIAGVDFISLDVQGAELEILKGGKKLLQTALGMEVEVEFTPVYIGQPLFADIDIFLREEGFTFFQFHFTHNGHFAGRTLSPISVMHEGDKTLLRQIAGQLVSADAIYLWDPIEHRDKNIHDLSVKKILKLVCISEVSKQLEYAFELLAWLQNLLLKTGEKHDAQIVEQIYIHAAKLYKNPSVNQYQPT